MPQLKNPAYGQIWSSRLSGPDKVIGHNLSHIAKLTKFMQNCRLKLASLMKILQYFTKFMQISKLAGMVQILQDNILMANSNGHNLNSNTDKHFVTFNVNDMIYITYIFHFSHEVTL